MNITATYPIHIVQKKNIKRLKITIAHNEGIALRVNLPYGYSKEYALRFVNEHRAWIEHHAQKLAKAHEHLMEVMDSHADEILIFGSWNRYDPALHTQNALKMELKRHISSSIERYSNLMNLAPKGFKIRKNRYRLGSCRSDGMLSFSLLLIFAPRDVIDYVIVHELAHIAHQNHSPRFWQTVARFYPRYQEAKAFLKARHGLFMRLLSKLSRES